MISVVSVRALADAVENFRRKVQACGRCSDGADWLGVDGLVLFAIGRSIRAIHVRRQGNVPNALQNSEEVVHRIEAQVPLAERASAEDLSGKLVRVFAGFGAEINSFSDAEFSPGMHQCFPLHWVGRKLLREQHLDPPTEKLGRSRILGGDGLGPRPATVSEEPGGQDFRIVEDQQIVRSKQLGKVAKCAVFQQLLAAIEVHQPRRSTVGQRLLGDQVVRKVVVEIRNQHTPIMPDHGSSHINVTQSFSAAATCGTIKPKVLRGVYFTA